MYQILSLIVPQAGDFSFNLIYHDHARPLYAQYKILKVLFLNKTYTLP